MSQSGSAKPVKIPVKLDTASLTNSINDLKRILNTNFDNIAKSVEKKTKRMTKSASDGFKNMERASNRAQQTITRNLNSNLSVTRRTTTQMNRAIENANSRNVRSTQRSNEQIRNNHSTTTNRVAADWSKTVGKIGSKMSKLGSKLTKGISIPIAFVMGASVKKVVDWESAFAGVRKTVNATEKEFEELENGILNMTKKLPQSAEDIAGVAEAAGQLGIHTDAILGFSEVMVKLGDTTNLTSEAAAMQLAKFANIVGMSQKEFDRLGSVIVDLGNNLATTESDIVEMGMRIAGAGNQIGMSEHQIMALAGALSSVGIEAEMGGSAISKLLINMSVATKTGGEKLKEFAKAAGVSTKEFKRAFEEDATQGLLMFLDGLKNAEKRGTSAIQILSDMEINEVRLRDTILRASSAVDLFGESLDIGAKAWQENNALTKEAEQRYGTNASKLEILKNKVSTVARQFGEVLLPVLVEFMEKISGMLERFSKLDEGTQKMIMMGTVGVAVLGPLLTIFGNITKVVAGVPKVFGLLKGASTAATTATVTQAASASAAASVTVSSTGIMAKALAIGGKAVGLLANPWVAIPAIVGISTVAIVKRTQSMKKSIEKNMNETSENILGLGDSFEKLQEKTKDGIKKLNKMPLKIFGGKKELKRTVTADFIALEEYIKYGTGNAKKILNDMVKDVGKITPNLSVKDKTNFGNFTKTLTQTFYKAGDITEKEAKDFEKKINKMLNLDVKIDFNLDEQTIKLKMNDSFRKIDEVLGESQGLLGWKFFGDSKIEKATEGIKQAFEDLKNSGINLKKVKIEDVFNNLSNSMANAKLDTPKEQIKLIQKLGDAFIQLGEQKGAGVFNKYAEELKMTTEEIRVFINNTLEGFNQMPEETQKAMIGMIANINGIKPEIENAFNGSYAGLLNDNAAFWGSMLGEYIRGQENVKVAMSEFKANLTSWVSNLAPEDVSGATVWLSTMLSSMQEKGYLTQQEANKIAGGINGELSKIEGADVNAKVSIDTTGVAEGIASLQGQLNQLVGHENYNINILANDVGYQSVVAGVSQNIESLKASNPTVDVKAETANAMGKLESILNKLRSINMKKDMTIRVNTIETTTKQTINKGVINNPSIKTNSGKSGHVFSVGSVIEGAKTAFAGITQAINTTPTFSNAIQNINGKNISNASKNIKNISKEGTPAIINCYIDMDGKVIAKSVSNIVDIQNGRKYVLNKRRFG